MKTIDNLNYYMEAGVAYVALSIDDEIIATDFVREMFESPMYSESGGWDKTFKKDAWSGSAWHMVSDEMPGWVGKTYREYMDMVGSKASGQLHELVRVLKI